MYGTDIAKAVGPHVAKLSDQPCASSTADEQNDVAVQEVEKSDNCIMIHDDDLVVDLQDEPVEGIRKLEEHPLDGERKKPTWRENLFPYSFHFGRSKWCKDLKTPYPAFKVKNKHRKTRVRRKRKWNDCPD